MEKRAAVPGVDGRGPAAGVVPLRATHLERHGEGRAEPARPQPWAAEADAKTDRCRRRCLELPPARAGAASRHLNTTRQNAAHLDTTRRNTPRRNMRA